MSFNTPNNIDYQLIFDLIIENSSVLDLGCGNGELLNSLKIKNCFVQGVDIDSNSVKKCIEQGIPIIQSDIDQGFLHYLDNSFDYVILNRTLQATRKPLEVMKEARRVGKKVIVSFPNFGYFIIRSQLFFQGLMPKSEDLPYEWYDTPNIHLVTIRDFQKFCKKHDFKIEKTIFYTERKITKRPFPNLTAPYALFVVS